MQPSCIFPGPRHISRPFFVRLLRTRVFVCHLRDIELSADLCATVTTLICSSSLSTWFILSKTHTSLFCSVFESGHYLPFVWVPIHSPSSFGLLIFVEPTQISRPAGLGTLPGKMSDQGAGGHIGGDHMHGRSGSQAEPAAAAPVESRNPSPEADDPRTESDVRPTTTAVTASPDITVEDGQSPLSNSSSPPPVSELKTPSRPLEPPVTKATLSELDVTKIIHNPKLRHDINFDPELHFRPNLDGEKGRRKQDKANQFWTTLQDQLSQFVLDREAFCRQYPTDDDWCLPSLLRAVKEIIQTLVPQRDRDFLNEGLNVELLMQQFNRGIADLEKLASWLSGVLKLHCAPMRDEWVDEMYNELSNGNRNNDMDELVKGMRSLLSVLEAMKLDVANHQIRCLRPVLIEDTVHFEQRFFFKKIQGGRLDIGTAQSWYREVERTYTPTPQNTQLFGETAVFFEGLARLILPSTKKEGIPNTFLFDEERIVKLRSDMLDAINLEVCMRLYDDLERVSRVSSMSQYLPTSVPSYVMDDDAVSSHRNSSDFSFINTPPSRPSSLALSANGSATSSPRNSGYVVLQPPADITEARTKARNVYDSLLALLNTASPGGRPVQRWHALVPAIAIEIFRFTSVPQDMLPVFEARLQTHLCEMESELYLAVEQHFHSKVLVDLGKRAKEFRDLSGVGLFTVATGGRLQGPGRTWMDGNREGSRDRDLMDSTSLREAREEGGIDDMATRLAHLGVLHWRVWAQMAYAADVDVIIE